MSIQIYLNKMKEVHSCLLNYIDDESDSIDNFVILVKLLKDQDILSNKLEFKSFLHLVVEIFNNHHHFPKFFDKIFQILQHLKEYINNFFSGFEILNIFQSNNRLLLFLIEEKFITINNLLASKIIQKDGIYDIKSNRKYFFPELQTYYSKEILDKIQRKKKNQILKNTEKLVKMIIIYVN